MGTIGRGAAGPATKELQSRLKERGYPDLSADGIFGAGTEEAVRDFQKQKGLAVDGIAGPDMFEALGLGRDFAARIAGGRKKAADVKRRRAKIFISYSHRDTRWLKRLRVHLRPLERDFGIDIWDDTQIQSGTDWRESIRQSIDEARGAILLVSADFLASDFIASDELPPLLEAAAGEGATILPVIVSHCRFLETKGLSQFQSVNPPERPLSAVPKHKQEETLLKVSREVERLLRAEKSPEGRAEQVKGGGREAKGAEAPTPGPHPARPAPQPPPGRPSISGYGFNGELAGSLNGSNFGATPGKIYFRYFGGIMRPGMVIFEKRWELPELEISGSFIDQWRDDYVEYHLPKGYDILIKQFQRKVEEVIRERHPEKIGEMGFRYSYRVETANWAVSEEADKWNMAVPASEPLF